MRQQPTEKLPRPQTEYEIAVASLQQAATRATLAKAARPRKSILGQITKLAGKLDPEAARRIEQTVAGLPPPAAVSTDDRWALMVEMLRLRRDGWSEDRLARALLSLKIFPGDPHDKKDVGRARARIRKQLSRHHRAVTPASGPSQVNDSPRPAQDDAYDAVVNVCGGSEQPGPINKEQTMAARLIKRVTTETFQVDDEELLQAAETNEDEELEEEEEEEGEEEEEQEEEKDEDEECEGEEECQ